MTSIAKEPKKCSQCRGTGKLANQYGITNFNCTSCNGTGLAGEPGLGLVLGCLGCAVFWIGLLWLLS